MSLLTLGTAKEGQRIDDLSLETDRRFMHHYNFPPYSVGETGLMRGPKRRDIGHGALAQRALEPIIPAADEFPYTIRIVSETLESNGSSSMGSVCGSTLALMDAGVPIKAPVSGIAMGLVKEGDDYVDPDRHPGRRGPPRRHGLQGRRDAATGITALQMDIKITGVTQEIMRSALEQAKRARGFILDRMARGDSRVARGARRARAADLDRSRSTPRRSGMVIGKGGETIRSLEADYDVQIDIEEDGTILIYATEGTKADAAINAIQSLTKQPEVGDTYTGKIVKTTQFGAFVELKKGTDGLLHVSNVGPGRVGHIEDVIGTRRRRGRGRPGGGQGPRPDRAQARGQARERRPRPARGADRAREERAPARARGTSTAPATVSAGAVEAAAAAGAAAGATASRREA